MQAWIERSLERLEWLESERERLAAEGPSASATLAEYDTEIATLYEVLEGAADDDGAAVPTSVADEYTLTFIEHVGWTTFRDLEPLEASPIAIAIATPTEGGFDFVIDEPFDGGSLGWRWIIPAAAAVLLFVGLGAWLGLRPGEAVASTPIDDGGPTQIDAAAIPDDTQEPKAARGIAAERTPATKLDAAPDAPAPSTTARTKRVAPTRSERGSSTNAHAIDLGKSREPLAGLR